MKKKIIIIIKALLSPFPSVRGFARWFWRQTFGRESKYERLERKIDDCLYLQRLYLDYCVDIAQCRKAFGSLRQYQLTDVTLLKEFLGVCSNHNISCSLWFGSLLGAVRHGGFVPWDNDLDVAMLKSDFDKLKDLESEFEKNGIKFIDWWVPGTMGRIVFDSGNSENFVDIYAFAEDGSFVRPLPPWGTSSRYSKPIPKDWVFPLERASFEGIECFVPKCVEKVLRVYYGNYMTFPSHAHNVAGHALIDQYLEPM